MGHDNTLQKVYKSMPLHRVPKLHIKPSNGDINIQAKAAYATQNTHMHDPPIYTNPNHATTPRTTHSLPRINDATPSDFIVPQNKYPTSSRAIPTEANIPSSYSSGDTFSFVMPLDENLPNSAYINIDDFRSGNFNRKNNITNVTNDTFNNSGGCYMQNMQQLSHDQYVRNVGIQQSESHKAGEYYKESKISPGNLFIELQAQQPNHYLNQNRQHDYIRGSNGQEIPQHPRYVNKYHNRYHNHQANTNSNEHGAYQETQRHHYHEPQHHPQYQPSFTLQNDQSYFRNGENGPPSHHQLQSFISCQNELHNTLIGNADHIMEHNDIMSNDDVTNYSLEQHIRNQQTIVSNRNKEIKKILLSLSNQNIDNDEQNPMFLNLGRENRIPNLNDMPMQFRKITISQVSPTADRKKKLGDKTKRKKKNRSKKNKKAVVDLAAKLAEENRKGITHVHLTTLPSYLVLPLEDRDQHNKRIENLRLMKKRGSSKKSVLFEEMYPYSSPKQLQVVKADENLKARAKAAKPTSLKRSMKGTPHLNPFKTRQDQDGLDSDKRRPQTLDHHEELLETTSIQLENVKSHQ